MMTTSKRRIAKVTAILVHQTQGATSMRCLPECVDRAMLRRSLPPSLHDLVGRTSGTGSVEDRRDDDTAAKEYSPPAPSVFHGAGETGESVHAARVPVAQTLFWGICGCAEGCYQGRR